MSVIVTGGIATGKSTVSKIFKEFGYEVVDADEIAHKELENSKDEIVKVFGSEILKDKKIDRKKLGSIVFSDTNSKKRLEEILHPKIRKSIEKTIQTLQKEGKKFIIDIPLYFESGEYKADKIVLVYAPKEMQLKRVMQRDKLTNEEALKRIESQMDIEKKRKMADIVINNTKDIKHLRDEVKDAIFQI
jgi:dephospho-CoA kinase